MPPPVGPTVNLKSCSRLSGAETDRSQGSNEPLRAQPLETSDQVNSRAPLRRHQGGLARLGLRTPLSASFAGVSLRPRIHAPLATIGRPSGATEESPRQNWRGGQTSKRARVE